VLFRREVRRVREFVYCGDGAVVVVEVVRRVAVEVRVAMAMMVVVAWADVRVRRVEERRLKRKNAVVGRVSIVWYRRGDG